ncbi:MAG: DNA-3-methyladenine glycosylase [Chloroflexota bacterium]
MLPWNRSEFALSTTDVARALLGSLLVHNVSYDGSEHQLVVRIVETEAYLGPEDAASHARFGKTNRSKTMFGQVGRAYVYFTYGVHWMFNVVAYRNCPAGAVLIRAGEPVSGEDIMRQFRPVRQRKQLTNGPAKLCQALGITGEYDGLDLCITGNSIWLAHSPSSDAFTVKTGPRIGLGSCSEPWLSQPYRYWIDGNEFVSR